jgi:hypothetical protein
MKKDTFRDNLNMKLPGIELRLLGRPARILDAVPIKEFSLFLFFRPALRPTQPPTKWVPGVKQQRREADCSPPSNAKIKNGGAIPQLPYTSSRRGA